LSGNFNLILFWNRLFESVPFFFTGTFSAINFIKQFVRYLLGSNEFLILLYLSFSPYLSARWFNPKKKRNQTAQEMVNPS